MDKATNLNYQAHSWSSIVAKLHSNFSIKLITNITELFVPFSCAIVKNTWLSSLQLLYIRPLHNIVIICVNELLIRRSGILKWQFPVIGGEYKKAASGVDVSG